MKEENLLKKCEIYFSIVEDYRREEYITYKYGLHLPLCTDTIVAERMCDEISEKYR